MYLLRFFVVPIGWVADGGKWISVAIDPRLY